MGASLVGALCIALVLVVGLGREPGQGAANANGQVGLGLVEASSGAAAEAWLPRYDLSEVGRRATRLPRALREISGLAVDGRGRLFAHDDESAMAHVIDPQSGAILETVHLGPRGSRGDFEGIAEAGDRFFLVTSAGILVEFLEPPDEGVAMFRRIETELDGECEFEGLAYDSSTRSLLLPCKTTRGRDWDDQVVIFGVPVATLTPEGEPRFAVPRDDLVAAGIDDDFHPTAIEIHPRSGSLFLLAAQEEAIIEVSREGRVIAARQLSRAAHPQPEGIAFGSDLKLWIADEGGSRRGTLTAYPLVADQG